VEVAGQDYRMRKDVLKRMMTRISIYVLEDGTSLLSSSGREDTCSFLPKEYELGTGQDRGLFSVMEKSNRLLA